MTAPTAVPATRLTRLAILFGEAGCTDRDERIQLVQVLVDRPDLTSTAQLTADEVHRLTRWLRDDPLIVDRARAKLVELGRPAPVKKKRAPRKKGPSAAVGKCDVPQVTAPEPDGNSPAELDELGDPITGPVDVECLAQAAVNRHRARAGAIATPPAPAEIPPRVPVPYTVTGRYCMPPPGTCYCGTCPWWEEAPPVNYKAAIAALREKQTGGGRR